MPINYDNEAHVYLKLLQENYKITQENYCELLTNKLGEPVNLRTFRAHLAKARKSDKTENHEPIITEFVNSDGLYDWESMKAAFLSGSWRTVSEFGRTIGVKPRSAQFLSMTAGWTAQKKQLRKQVTTRTAELLVETRAAEKVRDLFLEFKVLQWQFFDGIKMAADSIKKWKPLETPFSSLTAATFFKTSQEVLEKLVPSLRGLEKLEVVNDIFTRLGAGKIDVAESAIEFAVLGVQLPDVVKIMLTRNIGEEVQNDGGELVSNETILERRRQREAEIEKQRVEFVPKRTKEVNELKEELKDIDSFEKQKKLTDTDPTGNC
jgi:hypothetical protein